MSPLHSHWAETCHGCSKLVKEEPAHERQEIVHEGGDGENQRELFILSAAVCGYMIRKKRKTLSRQSLWYNFISFEEQVPDISDEIKASRYLWAVEVRTWHWPSGCVALTPVALTHRELKKPSVFRTKTSEAHPNTAPAKHRHSTRPEAKVKLYLTLMVPTHSRKRPHFFNLHRCDARSPRGLFPRRTYRIQKSEWTFFPSPHWTPAAAVAQI